jgi:Sec7 domain/PH domain
MHVLRTTISHSLFPKRFSLRHFLTASGFKLPGEAQQIDRLLNTFAQCFFEDNAGDNQRCPFKDQDTVYLLVFAIIMLNTDLHKSDSTSRKPHKKMSKLEFTNNLRGATQSESVARDYLSIIYDSIEANPIQLHTISDTDSFAKESQIQSLDNIWKNVAVADSLLRGLSVHNFRFATVDDLKECLECPDQQALAELTRSCVAKTWHHWHGALNTCLENAHLDPQGMEPAVDILLYALTATVCLNMPMERSAFLSQLVRLRAFEERRQGRWVSPPDNSHRKEQWYIELEEASAGGTEKKLWALETIYDWIQSLKAALRVDVRHKVEMTEAVAELNDADFLLQDPARSFIQSGNLMKKSGRTGRTTMYRFYLFSDVLLYASKDANGRYKIHEELPLHHMKIVDWFPPFQKNRKIMFEIHHPTKTFQVVCLSEDSRKSWVENIRASILLEMERKIVMEAARASVSADTNSMK